MKLNLESELDLDGVGFTRVSRPESAAPSVGQSSVHQQELQDLLTDAFA
jgi:2-oxoglutarate dehydrogenase complex dehydrogenase (E1) component-like enzyme